MAGGIGFRPLAKMIILPAKGVGIPFVAMYNPSTVSFQRGQAMVKKDTTQVIKGEDVVTETKALDQTSLTVELFFDGTGASPPMGISTIGGAAGKAAGAVMSAVGVEALITLFFNSTLDVTKKEHTTKDIKVIWGAGLFLRCKLQSANVTYTLINRLGLPLRATISATFTSAGDSSLLSAILSKFQSPDVTKTYLVKSGDTIYNIAKEEYDDESFYLQIAQANDLKNYRKLVPGQTLILPPIKQDEI